MNNPQLEDGYTQIADEILEALARTNLSQYQHRIVYTIFRKTYGYGKRDDWISLSQFEAATGMRRQHVWRALKELEARKIVTRTGYNNRVIRFNKRYAEWVSLPGGVRGDQGVTRSGTGVTRSGSRVSPDRVTTIKSSTIKTVTKESGRTPNQIAKDFFTNEETQSDLIQFFVLKGGVSSVIEQELRKFVDYWTEPNKSGTRTRWEMQATFDVKRRLIRWFGKVGQKNRSGRGVTVIT